MMSFSNDLNLLAANNIIGYDTYSQTIGGMGLKPRGYNPYGVGVLNTGVKQDTFTGSSPAKAIRNGILSACGFAIGTRIISEFQMASNNGKTGKQTLQQAIEQSFNLKSAKPKVQEAAKGFKGFLTKLGKGAKATAIVAGVGAALVTAAKIALGKAQRQQFEVTETGQPKS